VHIYIYIYINAASDIEHSADYFTGDGEINAIRVWMYVPYCADTLQLSVTAGLLDISAAAAAAQLAP
jgi:hypothetical protein